MNHSFSKRSLTGLKNQGLQLRFRDDRLAPEIDRDLLVRLVRQELTEETAQLVFRLIHSFESWRDAHAEILVDEFDFSSTTGDGVRLRFTFE